MADPLSIAGGVAALLSLSIQMTGILQKYVSSVKNARKVAKDLTDRLTALTSVLEHLEQFAEKQAPSGHFTERSIL
jgi:hypothetical protein